MKNILLTLVLLSGVFLTSCSSEKPLTDEEKAAKYGLTMEQYNQMKEGAERMGMNVDDHLKMMGQ